MTLRIGEILKQKGYTYSDLESLMVKQGTKLSSVSISNIVTGKQSPKVETLESIAKALNVSINECFNYSGPLDMKPIFEKNDQGNFVEIGYMKK